MILLPDGESSVSSHWITFGAGVSDPSVALQTDNGATSYVKCNDNLESMIIEYANPSVAEGDISSIDSVRFLSSGKAVHRTDASLVRIGYEVPSGNPLEQVSYLAHRTNYTTINGTSRTSYDGNVGTGWTYAQLQSLELICIKIQTIEVYLSYLALEVTYTKAVAADNATFFGANF